LSVAKRNHSWGSSLSLPSVFLQVVIPSSYCYEVGSVFAPGWYIE
jgi:hypothetical protein